MPRKIDLIIIHCSASPNGRADTLADITRWHTDPPPQGNGWPHVGYHYVVELDGKVAIGLDDDTPGYHASGLNQHSLGICLVGTDQFTAPQWIALKKLLTNLQERYPAAKIIGHNQINSLKTCPGFDVQAWIARGYAVRHNSIFSHDTTEAQKKAGGKKRSEKTEKNKSKKRPETEGLNSLSLQPKASGLKPTTKTTNKDTATMPNQNKLARHTERKRAERKRRSASKSAGAASKPAYMSKTIQGATITLASTLLPLLLAPLGIIIEPTSAAGIIKAIFGLFGGALAIYGRIVAETRIA